MRKLKPNIVLQTSRTVTTIPIPVDAEMEDMDEVATTVDVVVVAVVVVVLMMMPDCWYHCDFPWMLIRMMILDCRNGQQIQTRPVQ